MNNDNPEIHDLYLEVERTSEVRIQVCKECGVLLAPEEYFFGNNINYYLTHLKFHEFLARGNDDE